MLEQSPAQVLDIGPADIRAEVMAGNLERAETLCLELLGRHPNDGRLLNIAGNVAVRMRALDRALERFGLACRIDPNQPEFHLNRAMVLELQGNTAEALDAYQSLVAQHPSFTTAVQRLAKALFKVGRHQECHDLLLQNWPLLSGSADMLCLAGALQRLLGDAVQARESFEQALRINPVHTDALIGRASLALADGDHKTVLRLLEPLADQVPDSAELQFTLACAYEALNQSAKAALHYERAINDASYGVAASFALGRIRRSQKQMREAADAFGRIVAEQPDNFAAIEDYCEVLAEMRDGARLREIVPKIIALQSDSPRFWNNIAVHLKTAKLIEESIMVWRVALSLSPGVPQLYFNLANTLGENGRPEECEPLARHATALNPRYVRAWNLLGVALCRQSRHAEAWEAINECLRVDPKMAEAHVNAGVLHRVQGNVMASIAAYRKAIECRNDYAVAHHNLSTLLLTEGELAEGFREFEWRWGTPNFPSPKRPFPQPIWKGQDISDAAVTVWMEQGVGDEMMFAYFIPHMEKMARRCLIECDERLVPLFRRSFAKAEIYPRTTPLQPPFLERDVRYKVPVGHVCQYFWHDVRRAIRKNWDVHTALALRTPGYLKPDPDRVQYWRDYLERKSPGTLKVGFSWRSGMRNAERDPQFMELDEICRAVGSKVTAVNLQYSTVADEITFLSSPESGLDFIQPEGIDLKQDLDDLAALMSALDVIVTAFTSVGQMAGALGVPAWIFYNSGEERIWQQLGTPFIPWHPSTRLFFRQRPEQGWEAVIERMRGDMERLIEARQK